MLRIPCMATARFASPRRFRYAHSSSSSSPVPAKALQNSQVSSSNGTISGISNRESHDPIIQPRPRGEMRLHRAKKLPPGLRDKVATWLSRLGKEKLPESNNKFADLWNFDPRETALEPQTPPAIAPEPRQKIERTAEETEELKKISSFLSNPVDMEKGIQILRDSLRYTNDADEDYKSLQRALTCRLLQAAFQSKDLRRVTLIYKLYKPDLEIFASGKDGIVVNALISGFARVGDHMEMMKWYNVSMREIHNDDDSHASGPANFALVDMFESFARAKKAVDAFNLYGDLSSNQRQLTPRVMEAVVSALLTDSSVFTKWRDIIVADLRKRFNPRFVTGFSVVPLIPDTMAHVCLINSATSRKELEDYISIINTIILNPDHTIKLPNGPVIEQRLLWRLWDRRVSSALLAALIRLDRIDESFLLLNRLAALNQCPDDVYYSYIQALLESPSNSRSSYLRATWQVLLKNNVIPSNSAIRRYLGNFLTELKSLEPTSEREKLQEVISDINNELNRARASLARGEIVLGNRTARALDTSERRSAVQQNE